MKEVIIGIISGMVSGIGMGGGTVLILLLTMFMNTEQHTAQATNLIFFVPTSISAIIMNIKEKNINLGIGIKVAIFGVIGAIIGSRISNKLEVNVLRKYFGFFLAVVGSYQIYLLMKEYILCKKRENKK